jgi:hypothetical protein
LNVPVAQEVQLPLPAAETVPTAHDEHAVGPEVARTSENEPASQDLQVLWPAAFWKVPAVHIVQAAAFATE